jgi:hypothetical protein
MKLHKTSALAFVLLAGLTGAHASDALLEEARKVATSVPPKLMAVLQEEIAKAGPEGAIPVCREQAPQIAGQVAAETGWKVKRVSLKTRNGQRATPDDWERSALEEFERRLAAGEAALRMEKGEVVEAGEGRREFRYVKALPVQKVCLGCHGPADGIKAEVKAKLQELYPHDQATGYGEGQIRGVISIRKPL